MRFDKSKKSWTMGTGLGNPLVWRTKPPEPPGCLNLEDLQTLHIPTNYWFGHNTGYFFLSLVATSVLSRKFWGTREIYNEKNLEIRKNPKKKQAWTYDKLFNYNLTHNHDSMIQSMEGLITPPPLLIAMYSWPWTSTTDQDPDNEAVHQGSISSI